MLPLPRRAPGTQGAALGVRVRPCAEAGELRELSRGSGNRLLALVDELVQRCVDDLQRLVHLLLRRQDVAAAPLRAQPQPASRKRSAARAAELRERACRQHARRRLGFRV